MSKICFLNIRHGSSILKFKKIIKKIIKKNPDLISFSEFRKNKIGVLINQNLLEKGYKYSTFNRIDQEGNHVIIYSKVKFDLLENEIDLPKKRIVKIAYKSYIFIFVHIPGIKNIKYSKKIIWDSLYNFLLKTKKKVVMVGDFNTGLNEDTEGSLFKYNTKLKNLLNTKFYDLWKEYNTRMEYTWYSVIGNGFRVDQVITQKENKTDFLNCYYDHSIRSDRLSDHSMVIIEMKN